MTVVPPPDDHLWRRESEKAYQKRVKRRRRAPKKFDEKAIDNTLGHLRCLEEKVPYSAGGIDPDFEDFLG